MLNVGDVAPHFEGKDCQGRDVRLADFRGRRVVLFFFPKAFTIGCTEEVGHFRDNQTRIESRGAALIGISVDYPERQCAFAEQEGLEFSLLGDESRKISEAYGVLWPVLRIDRRVTFIIGADGRIESVIRHEVRVSRHLDDVLLQLGAGERRGAGWRPLVTPEHP